MPADHPPKPCDAANLRLFPGRAFAFSPCWEEDGAAVLFDRNSGDYWIVSPLARELVERVAMNGTLDAPTQEAGLVGLIRELVQREILIDA